MPSDPLPFTPSGFQFPLTKRLINSVAADFAEREQRRLYAAAEYNIQQGCAECGGSMFDSAGMPSGILVSGPWQGAFHINPIPLYLACANARNT